MIQFNIIGIKHYHSFQNMSWQKLVVFDGSIPLSNVDTGVKSL